MIVTDFFTIKKGDEKNTMVILNTRKGCLPVISSTILQHTEREADYNNNKKKVVKMNTTCMDILNESFQNNPATLASGNSIKSESTSPGTMIANRTIDDKRNTNAVIERDNDDDDIMNARTGPEEEEDDDTNHPYGSTLSKSIDKACQFAIKETKKNRELAVKNESLHIEIQMLKNESARKDEENERLRSKMKELIENQVSSGGIICNSLMLCD